MTGKKQERAKLHIDFTWQKNEDNNKNQNSTMESFYVAKNDFLIENS